VIHTLDLCGWQVASALPLPDLLPWQGAAKATPDITIDLGPVPHSLPDPIYTGAILQIDRDGSSKSAVPGVATFLVDPDGSRITIDTDLPPGSPAIRTFLLGIIFAIVCQRRQVIPLHASCIRLPMPTGDVAIAFTAPSGTGKSTLASAFMQLGYEVLADDITVLAPQANGSVLALPTFPRIKLWRDAMDRFEYPTGQFERVREEMEKFSVPLQSGFTRTPLRLAALYHLTRVNDERYAEVRRLQGLDATIRFTQAVYQSKTLMRVAQDRAAQLALAARTAAGIPAHWLLVQPNGLDKLDGLVRQIAEIHGAPAVA
jgi:hypothetical protein